MGAASRREEFPVFLQSRPFPPLWQDDVMKILYSFHQSCAQWILDHVAYSGSIVLIIAEPMVVVALLPHWYGDACLNKSLGAVALKRMHNPCQRRSGFQPRSAKSPKQVQMVRHNDRGVDDESIRRMQPANRIKHNVGAVLFSEKPTSAGSSGGQKIKTAELRMASFSEISSMRFLKCHLRHRSHFGKMTCLFFLGSIWRFKC